MNSEKNPKNTPIIIEIDKNDDENLIQEKKCIIVSEQIKLSSIDDDWENHQGDIIFW